MGASNPDTRDGRDDRAVRRRCRLLGTLLLAATVWLAWTAAPDNVNGPLAVVAGLACGCLFVAGLERGGRLYKFIRRVAGYGDGAQKPED